MKNVKKMLRKAVSGVAALAVCAVGVGTLPAGAIFMGCKDAPERFADDMKIEDKVWFEEDDYAVYAHSEGAKCDMSHLMKTGDCIITDLGENVDIDALESELREKVDENIVVTGKGHYVVDDGNKIGIRPSASEEGYYDGYIDMSETQAKEVFKILENYVDDAKYHTNFFTYSVVNWQLDEYFENERDTLEEYFRENNIGVKIEQYPGPFGCDMLKIIPDEEFSAEDYIELAGDILESTGINPFWSKLEDVSCDKGVSVNLADYTDGDANTDGQRTLADAVAILQSLANEDEYALTAQGIFNADIAGNDGVNINDALEIQRLATVEEE